MIDQKLSRRPFGIPLFIHGSVALASYLVWATYLSNCRDLYVRLGARGELPWFTECCLGLWNYAPQLFLLGFVVDVAVLFALSGLRPKARWLTSVWFYAVVVAIVAFFAITALAFFLPLVGTRSLMH